MKKLVSGMIIAVLLTVLTPLAVKAAAPNVIPSLREWTDGSGVFGIVSGTSRICVDPAYSWELAETANTFKADVIALNGMTLNVVNTSNPATGDFYLTLNCPDTGLGTEGYRIEIGNYAAIRSTTVKGVFYGTRTALQVLKQSTGMMHMPKGTARDYPQYKNRAVMIDVARKYFTVNFLKDYIKLMSWYKLNEFHIHFTDDNAFRLESTTYPGLAPATEKYTHADISSIMAVANKYKVNIVPEIDLPGHSQMLGAYNPNIKNQTFPRNLNLAKAETYTVVNNLLNEFVPLFGGTDFHIGTDETPNDGRGYPYGNENCDDDPETYNYALVQGYSTAGELYRKFINDYNSYIRNMGKTTRIWAWFKSLPGNIPISSNITYDAWMADYIDQISSSGFNIINSSAAYLYSVPSTGWQPDNAYLYQSWYPYMFGSFGTTVNLSPDDAHILGAQLCNWNDVSQTNGLTENEIEKILQPTARVLSEVTWGGPRSGSYSVFASRSEPIGIAPGLVTIGTENTNLAAGRPATASSHITNRDPLYATDGASATRWASAEGADPQWIYVDLGSPCTINRVKLQWESAYASAYKIQVSNDATNWTDVYTTSSVGGTENVSFPDFAARYVRMYGMSRGTGWGYSLWELGVYHDLPSGQNLALNRPAYSSSDHNTTTLHHSNVFDSIAGTRWSSVEGADPQWIYVDLGSSMNINRVKLNWESAYGKSYKIQTSTDGNTWTDRYSTTSGNGGIDDIAFPTVSARYVRLYGTQRGTGFGYSLWDMGVYYDTGNKALNRTAVASSVEASGVEAGKAFDGSASTRWSSTYSDPQWIYVDLGSTSSISRVNLKWQDAYAKYYYLQVSNDGANWNNVHINSNGDGECDSISFPAVNARYVRMYGLQRGTGYGYSLWEFEVY